MYATAVEYFYLDDDLNGFGLHLIMYCRTCNFVGALLERLSTIVSIVTCSKLAMNLTGINLLFQLNDMFRSSSELVALNNETEVIL